jgi:hypothetical protein
MHRFVGVALVLGVSLAATVARADATVGTLDQHTWPDVVATLQADLGSQGRHVPICVRDAGQGACRPCGTYALTLDAAGQHAFTVGACDPATGATDLTLIDRSALFDHNHDVARPRAIELRADVLSSVVASGGAASTGGSALGCTSRVRPFLHDLERGADVELTPDRYDVRVLHAGIDVTALGVGWMLVSESRIDTAVDYEVIERRSGERVMAGHATLECTSETRTTIDPAAISSAPIIHLDGPHFETRDALRGMAGGPVAGSTFNGYCPGFYPTAPQAVLDLGAVGGVRISATGEGRNFTLAVRTANGTWSCNDDGNDAPFRVDPIVTLASPPLGRVEIYVGTNVAGEPAPYRMTIRDPYVPHLSPSRAWLVLGTTSFAGSFTIMGAFDLMPDSIVGHGEIPSDEWRDIAWIPFVGPWIAQGVAGTDGNGFEVGALIDAGLQDLSLLAFVSGFLFQSDRHHGQIALGDTPGAPHLALGGGGSAFGATLAF